VRLRGDHHLEVANEVAEWHPEDAGQPFVNQQRLGAAVSPQQITDGALREAEFLRELTL
jgi:hypothetical protein